MNMYVCIHNRNKAFFNIAILLYKAIISELLEDSMLRSEVEKDLSKMLRASMMMDRPFFEGRLWLGWAINYLVSKGIIEKNEYVTQKMLNLYSRPDIIWDANPDFLPEYDRELNADAILLSNWLSDEDTLQRYVIQEWAINHINGLERVLDEKNQFYNSNSISSTYLISTLIFLQKTHKLKVYPTKVTSLLNKVVNKLKKFAESPEFSLYAYMNGDKTEIMLDKFDEKTIKEIFFYAFIFDIDLKIKNLRLQPYKEVINSNNLEQHLYTANALLKLKFGTK